MDENCTCFPEKSDFSEFSTQIVRFMVNFILNNANFPIFRKISSNVLSFWCILHENARIVSFYGKNLSIRGLRVDF